MNNYKLINKQTGEEHLCDKVVVDGWDYYVSDEKLKVKDKFYFNIDGVDDVLEVESEFHLERISGHLENKKVIATNNPNIDIPKLVDEVDVLIETMVNLYLEKIKDLTKRFFWKAGFKHGYNKSQETHPFSEEDVRFMLSESFKASQEGYQITSDEIIQIWKEQRTKTLYYEKIT